jgi:sulfur-carrier protein adenylyltransferase/sulfurtransferase
MSSSLNEPKGRDEDRPADGASEPSGPWSDFSRAELERYSRHFALDEIGVQGQARLRDARVLLIGAGGLGSPAALYLAAAGVGSLGIIDDDRVDLSNLQRQILHGTAGVGRLKVESAAERLREVNPHVEVRLYRERLTSGNARALVREYDIVLDGSDNFPTRYLVNDACVLEGRPWVYGAILRWEGQLSVFGMDDGPCYRCLFREPPPPGLIPGCAEAGVVGALPGIIGSLQAMEVVKWVVGRGRGMAGRLLIFDALDLSFREITLSRNPDCPVCGDAPTVHELIDYEHFCATGHTRAEGAAGTVERGRAAARAATSNPSAVGEVGVEELRRRLASGAEPPLLVDVREPWEWAVANLSSLGAIHLPLSQLSAAREGLERGRSIVLYCRTGARSEGAARYLAGAGFPDVSHLRGGLEAWNDLVSTDPGAAG